jgi:hypothetical protein
MNDLDDRLQRLAAEATKHARAPEVEVIMRRGRRRRALSGPVLAGTVALVVVLAAVVALAAVRGQDRTPAGPTVTTVPTPSTVSTNGWKIHTDVAGNLRFRYPPDWRIKARPVGGGGPDYMTLVPPGVADPAMPPAAFQVSWQVSRSFWIGENWVGGTTSLGRLPDGRPYLRTVSDSAAGDRYHFAGWSIDWGRPCLTGAARCVPHSVGFQVHATDGRLWDRYRAVAETIPATVEQLRPTAPTVGDRGLPACRSDQWRLVWVEEWGVTEGYQGIVLKGGVQYRQGPRCHLRLTLRLAVEDSGGRPLPVRGNPASTTVEGDLPVDGIQRLSGSWVIGGAMMWRFMWREWCNRGLAQASLRVTADGASLTVPGWTRRRTSLRPGSAGRGPARTGAGPRWSPAGREPATRPQAWPGRATRSR